MASSLKRKNDVGGADASKKTKVNGSITSFFKTPTSSSPSTATAQSSANKTASFSLAAGSNDNNNNNPASKFNKEAWLAKLTPEQKTYLKLEIETLDPSWLAVLKDEIVKPEFIALKKFLEKENQCGKKIFPPPGDIYSWSRHTPFHTVKCVIIGQDPYHNHNQAHGLCFSVRPPTPAPPSLKNMYIALKKDYPTFMPPPQNSGLLTPWAERGVLMLNTSLTVQAHAANSHQGRGWEAFTQRVIDLVAQKRTRGVVFLAWGKSAGDRVSKVDKARHLVLKSVHPSPLSASRGFFDCGHFRKTNEWLCSRYGEDGEIDWNLHPDGTPTTTTSAAAAAAAAAAATATADAASEKKVTEEEEKSTKDKTEKTVDDVDEAQADATLKEGEDETLEKQG
ncbi:uracil-DNA glycosylase [Xylaria sp. CBS 124048]|nr:uracil-DNA glycosylase [Xylaria sp. CBS 124048]